MKALRKWKHVAFFCAATVTVAYLVGSAGPISAEPGGCIQCDCKDILVWLTGDDNYGQGLVDATGVSVTCGSAICALDCPNTPFPFYGPFLDRRKYTDPALTCNNNFPPSTCTRTAQEASGTLTGTVLGQTNWAKCVLTRP
jgi:hypothetical protein